MPTSTENTNAVAYLPNAERLGPSLFIVRTQAGFRRMAKEFCKHYDLTLSDLRGYPQTYPALVAFSRDYQGYFYAVAHCYALSSIAERVALHANHHPSREAPEEDSATTPKPEIVFPLNTKVRVKHDIHEMSMADYGRLLVSKGTEGRIIARRDDPDALTGNYDYTIVFPKKGMQLYIDHKDIECVHETMSDTLDPDPMLPNTYQKKCAACDLHEDKIPPREHLIKAPVEILEVGKIMIMTENIGTHNIGTRRSFFYAKKGDRVRIVKNAFLDDSYDVGVLDSWDNIGCVLHVSRRQMTPA